MARPPRRRPGASLRLAGFQVSIIGRFWVSTEALVPQKKRQQLVNMFQRDRIRGTRIMVSVVLANLADGLTPQEIAAEYPSLVADDVQAAIAYAAELAGEEDLTPLRRESRP